MKQHDLPQLKLPRKIEADPRCEALLHLLAKDLRPLWEKGTVPVSHISLSPTFESILNRALGFKQLERGLERIEQVLGVEKKGLVALREKQGTPPPNRVSRLLILADDGAERFYRACESAVIEHGDRVLCLRVDVPSARLGLKLYGADKPVKALMVSDRDAVVHALLALVG